MEIGLNDDDADVAEIEKMKSIMLESMTKAVAECGGRVAANFFLLIGLVGLVEVGDADGKLGEDGDEELYPAVIAFVKAWLAGKGV